MKVVKMGETLLYYDPKNISLQDAKQQLQRHIEQGAHFYRYRATSNHKGEKWYKQLKELRRSMDEN